jgi:hypothetical protein
MKKRWNVAPKKCNINAGCDCDPWIVEPFGQYIYPYTFRPIGYGFHKIGFYIGQLAAWSMTGMFSGVMKSLQDAQDNLKKASLAAGKKFDDVGKGFSDAKDSLKNIGNNFSGKFSGKGGDNNGVELGNVAAAAAGGGRKTRRHKARKQNKSAKHH